MALKSATKRHLYISDSFDIAGQKWYYRINDGVYDWVISLTASSGELYDSINPFSIYAYKVRDPEIGWEGYIFAIYPKWCAESGCAIYLHTEATDNDVDVWLEEIARLITKYYYSDPEKFYDELEELDVSILSPEETETYEFVRPNPELARKLLNNIKRHRFIGFKAIEW